MRMTTQKPPVQKPQTEEAPQPAAMCSYPRCDYPAVIRDRCAIHESR